MYDTEYHLESKEWDEVRVEFSINAVKTKSLRAAINPKAWTHHCITYEKAIYKRNFLNEMKGNCCLKFS